MYNYFLVTLKSHLIFLFFNVYVRRYRRNYGIDNQVILLYQVLSVVLVFTPSFRLVLRAIYIKLFPEWNVSDGTSSLGQRSCGGTLKLSNSLPNFTLSSPYYYEQSFTSGYLYCYWTLISSPGQQVQLNWLDTELDGLYLDLYDHPTSSYYLILKLTGRIGVDISPIVSTQGGFRLIYQEYSSHSERKGFTAEISLTGKFHWNPWISMGFHGRPKYTLTGGWRCFTHNPNGDDCNPYILTHTHTLNQDFLLIFIPILMSYMQK